MMVMAGFGRIENRCPRPLDIVSARSQSFAEVSIHETRVVDGISRMRPVPTLTIGPDDAAVFAPGGMHLMLMQPSVALQPGDNVEIEFGLEDGGVVNGKFQARRP